MACACILLARRRLKLISRMGRYIMARISRRDLLITGLAAGISSIAPLDASAASAPVSETDARKSSSGASAGESEILPLTSSSGVYIPPRGESFFKFSYDFPEPSISIGGLQISFRVYTFENAYGLDQSNMSVEKTADGMRLRCAQFVWGRAAEGARHSGCAIPCRK